MGADAIKKRLEDLRPRGSRQAAALRQSIASGSGPRKARALKRLKVVERLR